MFYFSITVHNLSKTQQNSVYQLDINRKAKPLSSVFVKQFYLKCANFSILNKDQKPLISRHTMNYIIN